MAIQVSRGTTSSISWQTLDTADGSVKREGKARYVVLTAEQDQSEPLPKTGSVVGGWSVKGLTHHTTTAARKPLHE